MKSAVSLMAIAFVTCLEMVPPIAKRPSPNIAVRDPGKRFQGQLEYSNAYPPE